MTRARQQQKIIVVGGGVAGLTAAAYLAKAGHPVMLLERSEEVGGGLTPLRKDGYQWDLGPRMVEAFAPGEPGGRILKELGIQRHVALEPADRGVVFPDFDLRKPSSLSEADWLRRRLATLFPFEREGLEGYFRYHEQAWRWHTRRVTRELRGAFSHSPVVSGRRRPPKEIRTREHWSAQRLLDHFLVDPRLKAAFACPLMYRGVLASELPAFYLPLLNAETRFDARLLGASRVRWRPSYHFLRDGGSSLTNAIAEVVREHGGRIYTGARVERILVDEDRVRGVQLEGGHVESARVVIATGGARETFFELVGRGYLPLGFGYRIDTLQVTSSAFAVHLGVDFDPSPYQSDPLVYYCMTYDVEGAVHGCRSGAFHEGRDGFAVFIPSLFAQGLAPGGHHVLSLVTFAPNTLEGEGWQKRGRELARTLVSLAESVFPGLREHIVTRVITTPDDLQERTGQRCHAVWGIAPVLGQEGLGYETPIAGLWFVGSQSRSGGGILQVMIGARQAVRMILARSSGRFGRRWLR